ncbi:MAG TPA: DNA-directed RNA polymerase subunit beta [Candidatus Paceibacterota bacterium]|nr:DNA-directed RNA polymerase subunit beta [Candidatus Paceibacterota bacterium]
MNRKLFSKYAPDTVEIPNLAQVQLDSYRWFLEQGLRELLQEISPVRDWTDKEYELYFRDFILEKAKLDERTAKEKNVTYEAPLRLKVELKNKRTGQTTNQELYLGELPLMTERGTFIVNGVERVIISQLIRSPGILFFLARATAARNLFGAKLIPSRGAWLEFETEASGVIVARIDRKRKLPVTTLLRAFGISSDAEIKKLFADVDSDDQMKYILATIAQDPASSEAEGLTEVYRRIRPGDLATAENSKQMIHNMFFNFARYDLSRVGRHRMNQRFNKNYELNEVNRTLKPEDIVETVKEIIRLNNNPMAQEDNIDHLGNRRVKVLGELLQDKLRVAFAQTERIIKDRMSTIDTENVMPSQLINPRPFVARIKEFFSSGQLSQFMDQYNPLSELEHKRRMSAMGPGGLAKERATFDVRDVHPTHYGRICPIETPEGQNIGLVNYLSLYAKISPLGFITTPYRKVNKGKLTDEVVYLDASEEEHFIISQAGVQLDEDNKITDQHIPARIHGEPGIVTPNEIDYIDVSPKQPFSAATSLIPFLEHDDANRALMGSNMQRQAQPLIFAQAPYVGTGLEEKVARDSGLVLVSDVSGTVDYVDAATITIKTEKGDKAEYRLVKFLKSNAFTSINQKPLVRKGDKVKKGQIIADGPATDQGELALGTNILVAFLSFEGQNFEDAIVLSDRMVKEDVLSSLYIEEYSVDVRETKLGPELTTYDIPNVGEERLKDLDPDGVVRIGAEVRSQDILVGKISPKGESDLTSEERLLRAIFGEKSRDVKDTSLRLDYGKTGRVVGIRVFSRDQGDKLPAGVIKTIQISVAQMRKIQVGDKLAGRHGNKGVISVILPEEDMPFLPDGRHVDMVLSPLGILSRMNIGQVLETHLGWAAQKLGYKAAVPAMGGPDENAIKTELKKAGLPEDGRIQLFDGKSGLPYDQRSTVGMIYFMKLSHMVEDKIHMRSIGPYSLITQQPLGGKAQFGGQRFGEMEVWALEGYGAAHTLQEMLTIKSDDVLGRAKTYESIVNGEEIKAPHLPESFKVLLSEIKGLGLSVELVEK